MNLYLCNYDLCVPNYVCKMKFYAVQTIYGAQTIYVAQTVYVSKTIIYVCQTIYVRWNSMKPELGHKTVTSSINTGIHSGHSNH